MLGEVFIRITELPLPKAACARPSSLYPPSKQHIRIHQKNHRCTNSPTCSPAPLACPLPIPTPLLHHIKQADNTGEAIVRQSPIVMDSSDTRLDCFEHRKKTYMTTPALNLDNELTTFAAGLTVRYTTALWCGPSLPWYT